MPPPARVTSIVSMPPDPTTGAMITAVGLNPYRQMRRRRSDYVFVAVALVVAAVLVLWAFFG